MNIKDEKRRKKYEELQKRTKSHIAESLPMIDEQSDEGMDEVQTFLDESCAEATERVDTLNGEGEKKPEAEKKTS